MKVLAITNLFGYPWDPSRGVFNQQQFDLLSKKIELSVLVAVPWTEAIRHPLAYWFARRDGRKRWAYVDYFVFWHLPGTAQAFHSVFFFLSIVAQRPWLVLFRPWHAMVGSWGFPDAVATTALAAITRTPVLMKVHGTDVNDYLDLPARRWQILAAARRCAKVMTPSAALRSRLMKAGIPSNSTEVIYNGVDSRRFCRRDRAAARLRLAIEGDAPMLIFVGNLKRSKGCVDLLEAFLAIAAVHPTISLAVVGDGLERVPMRQRAIESGYADRVRFVGKAEHGTLPDWFAAASLLCLPSHGEGVPNVVLEAMACGVPVVATNVGGIPEVVPAFAGILVEPRDVPALQQAVLTALSGHWDRERISAHAHGFSWDANVEHVVKLLRDLPSEKTRPRWST